MNPKMSTLIKQLKPLRYGPNTFGCHKTSRYQSIPSEKVFSRNTVTSCKLAHYVAHKIIR